MTICNYIKYIEKSHFREKCRMIGNSISKYMNNNLLTFLKNILDQFLVLNEGLNGFLEGIMNITPLIELYVEMPPKEIFIETYKDKIIYVPKYNDEKIIDEIRRIFNPDIPLLEYNRYDIPKEIINDKCNSLYNKIDKILDLSSIDLVNKNKITNADESNFGKNINELSDIQKLNENVDEKICNKKKVKIFLKKNK